MLSWSLLFRLQNRVLQNCFFAEIFRETSIMSLKSTSFQNELLIKDFNLPNHSVQKKSETRFCRRKTAENDNANINVPPIIPCTFLLFKVSAFLEIFFPKKFLKIPFHVNQFIAQIEVKI